MLGLLFLTSSAFSEEPKQPLQLTIKSDKQMYEVDEKINIALDIKNNGKEPAKIYSPSIYDVAEIIVTDSKGKKMPPKEAKADINFGPPFITILAGETYHHIFNNLCWNSFDSIWGFFDEAELAPGIYNVYVTITNPPKRIGAKYLQTSLSGTLTSNTIAIEVKENAAGPIEQLAERLSKDYMWQNGISPIITLPSTATTEQVLSEVFKMSGFDQGHVTDYKILEVKEVQITGSLPDWYTAVLVSTNFGDKIVLLQYEGKVLRWWSRVYPPS